MRARPSRGDEPINFDLGPAGPQRLPPPLAPDDWNDLFNAVKERLTHLVSERPGSTADNVRSSILDCVDGLDQLHAAQRDAQRQSQRLELQAFDAQTQLAQLRNDLSSAIAREQYARHLSQHDGLTQLANSSHFRARLHQRLTQTAGSDAGLAVMYIDLDGFKQINDVHGHATGDELLKIISARLVQSVRSGDMVGRLGGDEFACLLAGQPSRQQLGLLARKLFDHVSAPIQIGRLSLTVRPSIGVAIGAPGADGAEALLKNADTAMFQAKRSQNGYAFFR
jgi:diguanylate cyclase (GGDEF)-like protein